MQLEKTVIIGVGGAGMGVISKLYKDKPEGMSFIAADTDFEMLKECLADSFWTIGEGTTDGKGTQGDAKLGSLAADKNRAVFAHTLHGVETAIVVCGLGGGTGSGAASVIARVARDMGIYTVAIVLTPAHFETKKHQENVERGYAELEKTVNTLLGFSDDVEVGSGDKRMMATELCRLDSEKIAELILKAEHASH